MLEHFDTILAFAVILTGVSLLIMAIVQMTAGFLALRGSNLRWGIQTLIANADPSLVPYARAIAQKVLHHPLISDSTFSGVLPGLLSRWRLATAIRKEELLEILRILANPPAGTGAPRTIEAWETALRRAYDKLEPDRAAQILKVAPQLKLLFAGQPEQLALMTEPLLTEAAQLSAHIDQWFDSMMDRASQRFSQHSRIWTILFSVAVALALHLDTFQLLTQLSTDSELRNKLVASADAMSHTAEETLASPPASALPTQTLKKLIAAHSAELGAFDAPPGFADIARAKSWLQTQLGAHQVAEPEKYVEEYDALVEASFRGSLDGIRSILDEKLKFRLVPDPYPEPFYNYWTPSWLHLWGILTSAALLSLGAPFWFNALKTMANLRPIVAQKESVETKA